MLSCARNKTNHTCLWFFTTNPKMTWALPPSWDNHPQRAPLDTPEPTTQGSYGLSWFLTLNSLTDPRSHQENGLPEALEPRCERDSLPPKTVLVSTKELPFYLPPHEHGFPHLFLLGGSSCRHDFMLFGIKAMEWEKEVLEPSHPSGARQWSWSLSYPLGHPDQQT